MLRAAFACKRVYGLSLPRLPEEFVHLSWLQRAPLGVWLSTTCNADLGVPARNHRVLTRVNVPLWAGPGVSHWVVSPLLGFLARAGIAKSISTIVELGVFAPRMTVGTVRPH